MISFSYIILNKYITFFPIPRIWITYQGDPIQHYLWQILPANFRPKVHKLKG